MATPDQPCISSLSPRTFRALATDNQQPTTLTRAEARRLLVAHHGLVRPLGKGARGVRATLEHLRCIQLDPLDVIGTNADLVVLARVDGISRGDVWRHLFPEHAFEHFFKERCILPAGAFPYYREQGHKAQARWWHHEVREQRVPPELVDAVLAEIRERGPVSAKELTDHGRVEPIDWAGWGGTAKTTSMALEILWTRCDVVVAGRTDNGAKLYDVPRALRKSDPPSMPFERWQLRERVRAAGLYAPGKKAVDGNFVEVVIEGSSRRYLTTPEFLHPPRIRYDDRVRILGPLDPLLWDRSLVRHVFDFDYVWEVYKPEPQRKWGWYVVPLLQRDRLIGRMDARIERNALVVKKLWLEEQVDVDRDAIVAALERHATACGASGVRAGRALARVR